MPQKYKQSLDWENMVVAGGEDSGKVVPKR